jgi:hypothetical protein
MLSSKKSSQTRRDDFRRAVNTASVVHRVHKGYLWVPVSEAVGVRRVFLQRQLSFPVAKACIRAATSPISPWCCTLAVMQGSIGRPAGAVELAFSWPHLRRSFFEFHRTAASVLAKGGDRGRGGVPHRRTLVNQAAHPRPPAQ